MRQFSILRDKKKIIVGQRQYPDAYAVASGGPAGTKQSSRMGVYLKNDSLQYNNRPFYQLDRGGQYLYYRNSGYWGISSTPGSGAGILTLQKGLLTPPVNGWRYYSSGWKEDPQLTVSGETINMFVRVSINVESNKTLSTRCSPGVSC